MIVFNHMPMLYQSYLFRGDMLHNHSMTYSSHIAIVGAGPAGLMAAEILARAGQQVTIYDRMPTPARKLLIAGRGGLNITHSEPIDHFIQRYGKEAEWLTPSIRAFTPDDLRAWCEGLGQETFIGSSGRVFPRSMKAVQLLRAWLARLEELGVRYKPRHIWQGWQGGQLRFLNEKNETVLVRADACLLALGGASWPRLGSTGEWTRHFPEQHIAPFQPSNCGFIVPWSPLFSERFAGMPLKPVAITHENISRQGEAMMTAQGIEGGIIYAFSAALRDAIAANGKTVIHLDTRPNMTLEAVQQKFRAPRGSKSLSNYLQGLGFSALSLGLLREAYSAEQIKLATSATLAQWLKEIPITLTAPTGIERAISSAGGITHDALTDDFMLRNKPGVFVAGEMLDWEAPTGGYLLQACFSTAVTAAQGMLRHVSALK
jgi:uncharacterized flavoprotein (TIGR03862 family)